MTNMLTDIKDEYSKLFVTDYEKSVIAEARTLTDLRKKLKSDSNVKKRLERSKLTPRECIWWWNPDTTSMFTIEMQEKHHTPFVVIKSMQQAIVAISPLELFENLVEVAGKTLKQ